MFIWFQNLTKYLQYKYKITPKSTKSIKFLLNKTQAHFGSTKYIKLLKEHFIPVGKRALNLT